MDYNPDLSRLILDGTIILREYGSARPTGPTYVPTGTDTVVGSYSEDGYEETPNPGDTEEYKNHAGKVVESNTDDGNFTIAFAGLETKPGVVETYYDTTVDTSDGSYEVKSAAANTYRDLIVIGRSKNNGVRLGHWPRVKISDRESIAFNRTTLHAYGMTFGSYEDPLLGYHFKVYDTLLLASTAEPAVSLVTPSGQGADEVVAIHGSGFAGATDVKFGTPSAADFVLVNDGLIAATLPTGSAGNVNVTVITPNGTSAPVEYART